jgi:uncharacterized protein (DUF1800 family)
MQFKHRGISRITQVLTMIGTSAALIGCGGSNSGSSNGQSNLSESAGMIQAGPEGSVAVSFTSGQMVGAVTAQNNSETGANINTPSAQSVLIPAAVVKSSVPLSELDAVRLAKQATFGPTKTSIAQIRALGLQSWIEAQTQLPSSGYPADANRYVDSDNNKVCLGTEAQRGDCWRDNYSADPIQRQFILNALTAPDQLRQRVAFALSQIFVISAQEINPTYAVANFQQMLANKAFGNFQDLLKSVTLHPAMGHYLDMVNSEKSDPNENYPRELLQLFSIGVYELNNDGSRKLSNGRPVASYDNEIVEGFAAAFSGYVYPPLQNAAPSQWAPRNYLSAMVPIAARHSTGSKKLLRGVTLASGQSADKDVNDAINNIFAHPNIAPFIGKQLIQHLVTSNPSPSYVERISNVFNNNGQGVKGDLTAVITAILVDPDARGDVKTDRNFGRLQDSILYSLQAMRAVNAKTDGIYLMWRLSDMRQSMYAAPSVFNFYPPDYALPASSTALVSPAYALINTNTSLARVNYIHDLLHNDWIRDPANFTNYPNASGTQINLDEWTALADDPANLVERIDIMLTAKRVPVALKQKMVARIAALNDSDKTKRNIDRARLAFYLIATSTAAQIEK